MKTENIAILKNTHNYDDFADDFLVCSMSDVTEGYLHDTYDRYGIPLDEYAAGDFCLANSESSMSDDIKNAIVNSEELRPLLIKLFPDEEIDSLDFLNHTFDDAVNIGCDGTVEVKGEEVPELTQFAQKYDEDNKSYTEATYVNYWDGSNWQTLLLSAQNLSDDCFELMSEDDEEYAPIIGVLKEYDTYIREGASKTEKIGDYEISHSLWSDDYFYHINRV